MPEQFVVPQFIDAEDKIFGPITARQFVILMVVGLTEFVLFKLIASLVVFLLFGVPLFALGVIFAFLKINGQAFHYFLLNIIQTFKKPLLRVWDKKLKDSELKAYMDRTIPPPPEHFKRKASPKSSRLKELSLVVNTGGVYQPDN